MQKLVTKSGWLLATLALMLMLSVVAVGQCSMCRASLAGSNSSFIRNFNIGVLVLLIPPVTIFCSIFFVLKRHRSASEPESEIRRQDEPQF